MLNLRNLSPHLFAGEYVYGTSRIDSVVAEVLSTLGWVLNPTVAGGAALGCLTASPKGILDGHIDGTGYADIDLYYHTEERPEPVGHPLHLSNNAGTFATYKHFYKYQLIAQTYRDATDAISHFDMDICRCALFDIQQDGTCQAVVHRNLFELANGAQIKLGANPPTLKRMIKYSQRTNIKLWDLFETKSIIKALEAEGLYGNVTMEQLEEWSRNNPGSDDYDLLEHLQTRHVLNNLQTFLDTI